MYLVNLLCYNMNMFHELESVQGEDAGLIRVVVIIHVVLHPKVLWFMHGVGVQGILHPPP